MNATTKLLTTVSVASVICRNIHVAIAHQEQKVSHMTEASLRHLFLRNLRRSTSVPDALFCRYLSLESISNPVAHREFNKSIMEPFLNTCYNPNTSATCEIQFGINSGNIVPCQDDTEDFTEDVDINLHVEPRKSFNEKSMMDKQRYKAMRKWKKCGKKNTSETDDSFVLRLLSFNILAQNLLESYYYLYKQHDKEALPWEVRKPLLQQEILEAEAHVICLQEMQEEHLYEFLIPFQERGYDYLYKKRTNDKRDGLLFLYRSDQFNLLDHVKVELYQPGVELLSRDNVGIIAKLSLKEDPSTQIVIATTHLLYNPRRNDVRLGQTQLLLAEIERIAFVENTPSGPKYLPIILSGDFNLEPFTGVYRFIIEGYFDYRGKGRNLEIHDYRKLSNSLIPPWLCITDSCQHFNILTKRLRGEGDGTVMLENSEYQTAQENTWTQNEVNMNTSDMQTIDIVRGHHARFSSGRLTHPFNLYSVYMHTNSYGEREATTHQGKWITVDYIFYSSVEPIEKYTLPTVKECTTLPTIPNFAVGSDHMCLGASFKVSKKK